MVENSPSGGYSSQGTAVVMGAGMAGLWAARVLSDHFERVLVIERDTLPSGVEPRPGVPQSRQYHILLLRGLQLLKELFPGLDQELVAEGAVEFDILKDTKVFMRNQWLSQFESGQRLLSCSRVMLEAGLRRRLRQDGRVEFVDDTEVAGLQTSEQGAAVTGARIRQKQKGEHPRLSQDVLAADLVVDALGRRSPTPEWLVQAGYPAPEESVVDSFLGYVTRRYRKPENWQADWRMLLLLATPPSVPRGGLIFPEENDTWVVMMAGINKNYPPTDDAGFDEFARSLGEEFYGAVQAAEPISKAYGYRNTDSRWRRYEKLTRWPERFVVLGDAMCGFNPIYGQGMTVAALSAQALGRQLGRANGRLDGLAQLAQREIGRITQGAWLLATGADLEWPGTVSNNGGQHLVDSIGRWYIARLLDAIPYDQKLRLAFNDVNQLLKPVSSLLAPEVALRVFSHRR